MIKKAIMLTTISLCITSCDQAQVLKTQPVVVKSEPESDKESSGALEKKFRLEERRMQIPAIVAAFEKRTNARRARYLAALCYLKTLDTPFMPMDMAEIALAETGSHGLSSKAVSYRGALGVWQLMPQRARSHGYTPKDMENDEKCADAAVRELLTKMKMAKGNLRKAKKLYCGVGPQADAYEVKRMRFRREILAEMMKYPPLRAESDLNIQPRPSYRS